MKKYLFLTIAALAFCGCKPTERNYQLAYDKASEAARAKTESESTGLDGVKLESLNGPRREILDGDTIMVAKEIVKPMDSELPDAKGKVGVAVAQYRMATNARRNVQDLKKEYPNAFVGTDGKEAHYVIIDYLPSLKDAAAAAATFATKHPDYHYMGLSGYPLAIYLAK